MWVIEDHLRPSGHIMPDHAGDRGAEHLVLAPHDHLHINHADNGWLPNGHAIDHCHGRVSGVKIGSGPLRFGLALRPVVAASYCSTTLAGMRPRSLTAMPWSFAYARISQFNP
jgi:hypothetical protein